MIVPASLVVLAAGGYGVWSLTGQGAFLSEQATAAMADMSAPEGDQASDTNSAAMAIAETKPAAADQAAPGNPAQGAGSAARKPARAQVQAAEARPVDEREPLSADDPRWAANGASSNGGRVALASLVKAAPPESNKTAPDARKTAPAPAMAAYAPRAGEPSAALDAGEVETAAIPPEPATDGADNAVPKISRTDRINDGVNMRVRGEPGAPVVMIVPRGASVGVVDCDAWCHIVYNGQSGYVYKSFLGRRAVASASPKQAQPKLPAATPAPEAKPAPVAPVNEPHRGR